MKQAIYFLFIHCVLVLFSLLKADVLLKIYLGSGFIFHLFLLGTKFTYFIFT